MLKGRWLVDIALLGIQGKIPFAEAVGFILARVKAKPTQLNINGVRFPQVDHILWSAILEAQVWQVYFLEPQVTIQAKDVVVDIGAHWGAFTSLAARQATQGQVFAFEPHPDNVQQLERVCALNNLCNVKTFPIAVSGIGGTRDLFVSANSSQHSLAEGPFSTRHTIKIPTMTLDQVLDETGHIDFLKMDCEGAETEIILNASERALTSISKIAMEVHHSQRAKPMRLLLKRLSSHFTILAIQYRTPELGYLYAIRRQQD